MKYNGCRVIGQSPTSKGIYVNCCWIQESAYGFLLSGIGEIFEGCMDRYSATVNSVTASAERKSGTANPNTVTLFDSVSKSGTKVATGVRLYYVEFADDGVPVYSFVPCAYNDKVGVYDKINGYFYEKQEFIKTIKE